ncbi:MAG: hypothetical protein FJX44_00200 [Alphaproteobacteria bacterium]|nr:hypothetical protein [Alphaproteobacteria bacterium]
MRLTNWSQRFFESKGKEPSGTSIDLKRSMEHILRYRQAATLVGTLLSAAGEEPSGTAADWERLETQFARYKKLAEEREAVRRELKALKKYGILRGNFEEVSELEDLKRNRQHILRYRQAAALVDSLLRAGGEEPSGTVKDWKRLRSQFTRYKRLAEERGTIARELKALKSELQDQKKYGMLHRNFEEISELAKKPSIVVASLPKAGTKYVGSTIAQTLAYAKPAKLYRGNFPNNTVNPRMARNFGLGGLVASVHIQCTPENMTTLLAAGIDRMVLHVRDPRATAYSWMHYCRSKPGLQKRLSQEFYSLSDDEQLEYHIDTFFKLSLKWLLEWSDYLDEDPRIKVLITSHEQLATDEHAFFQSIFDFYGITPEEFHLAPKDKLRNFRSGRPSEWRQHISPANIARMTELIPEHLFQRYGWTA